MGTRVCMCGLLDNNGNGADEQGLRLAKALLFEIGPSAGQSIKVCTSQNRNL